MSHYTPVVKMATDSESFSFDTSVENQEENLQDLTDEQLEQLLYDTLLVTQITNERVLVYEFLG